MFGDYIHLEIVPLLDNYLKDRFSGHFASPFHYVSIRGGCGAYNPRKKVCQKYVTGQKETADQSPQFDN